MLYTKESEVCPDLCNRLILSSLPHMSQALTGPPDKRVHSGSRQAWNYKYREDTADTLILKELIKDLSKADTIEQIEPIEVISYSPGGFYRLHRDGMNRRMSVMVVLNEGYLGGELVFPEITPPKIYIGLPVGSVIAWNSQMLHESRPVTRGQKWVAIGWVAI